MEGVADDHRCPWREEAEALRFRVAELEAKLATVLVAMEALERRVLGPKSEKMPPPESELRREDDEEDAEERRLAALRRRRERGELRDQLRRQTVQHHLGDEDKVCPRCGGVADRALPGKETTLYE
jgi:transposase